MTPLWLAVLVAIAGAGCAVVPADPNQPPPRVTTVDASRLDCRIDIGRHRNNSGCWMRGYDAVIITTGGQRDVARTAPIVAGQGALGGLFPPSVEQQLGVAPNECFVDMPGGNLRQVACVLGRPIKRFFDDLGGRALVYQ